MTRRQQAVRTTIVVGSGSSGGVVASRLSEDAHRHVVLIEAGPDYADERALPAPLRDRLNPDLTSHDWGFEAYFVEPADARPPVRYPRGKVVGGTSAVNGAVFQRGNREDFDGWAALGNDAWSWEQVLPGFVRCETDLDFGGEFHGKSGPIPVRRLPREQWPPPFHAFADACRARGFRECADHNEPGSTGFGPIPRNELGDLRASTLLAYVNPARGRPNLELRARTHVTRVLLERGRAVGVETVGPGGVGRIEGDEVVLCAGAIMSPHVLFHSGIGPRDPLAAAGLECVVDLAGVGRSLRDHSMAPLVAFEPPGGGWRESGFSVMLKWSSSPGRRNDLFLLGAVLKTTSLNFETPAGIDTVFTFAAVVGRPYSTGWLAPRSADPLEPPEIRVGFLSDDRDRALLREATQLGLELTTTPPLAQALGEVVIPPPALLRDEAALDRWLFENVTTGFHAVGTCRMGPSDDRLAVVDQALRVRGVDDLYVADASVMPDITSGLTNATCVMIGERFAQLLALRAPAADAAATRSLGTRRAR